MALARKAGRYAGAALPVAASALGIGNSGPDPSGIAQKPHLVSRLLVETSATRRANFFSATVELMQIMKRACGRRHIADFDLADLDSFDILITPTDPLRLAGS